MKTISSIFIFTIINLNFVIAETNPLYSSKMVVEFSSKELRRIMRLSPLLPPPVDKSNQFSENAKAIEFGRKLFFDKRLSNSKTMSCADCHIPQKGWTDGQPVVANNIMFPRNVPSIWNSSYNRWFYWDGRSDSAWAQALGPIENNNEMASDRNQIVHLLFNDRKLKEEYEAIFGQLYPQFNNYSRFPMEAKPVVDDFQDVLNLAWMAMAESDRQRINRVFTNLGKAIAAFERTIITPETNFDRFVEMLRSNGKYSHLNTSQQRGLKIFVGKGKCTFCHSGPNFSDGEFHDLGIAVGNNQHVDPGRYGAIKTLLQDPFNRIGPYADTIDNLAPVKFITLQGQQLAQFKTPSLRQLTHTAPYMHDGRFPSLRAVVEFYSTRKNARPLEHASNLVQPLKLSAMEIDDVVAFLQSLSTPE